MEWVERRAGWIGIGAIVVAAVALGVALASCSHSDHRMIRVGPAFGERFGAPPLPGGPMPGRYRDAPGLVAPGGPMAQRFDARPGRVLPGLAAVGALHGELTVPAPNGKYQTVDVQRGTVTNISASSLTVKSSDGFTKTYTITKRLASGVSKGDEVQVRATDSNGKTTVTGLAALHRVKR
jgi:hypothetical protein